MAVNACEAVLLDLLAQVRKFCEEQGEADFETGAAEAMKRRIVGMQVDAGLQRQLDKVLAAYGVAPSGLTQQLATAVEAVEAHHDPFCMMVLRGKECTCGVPAAPAPNDDSARLDWIERQGDEFSNGILQDCPGDGDHYVNGANDVHGTGKTFREAIDNARVEEGKGWTTGPISPGVGGPEHG